MKATAQQAQTTQTPKQRRTRARVQAKIRPGAGNRQRADAFERQAEQIATRAIRGERNLALGITPRAAAAFQTPDGAGLPLPRFVREHMESALGADLAAVRIHTTAAADEAARQFSAEAFASGRNIFFRSGFYSPHTSSGRELLAHELVHVLQQTGRRNTKGQLSATRVSGADIVQLAPSLQDDFAARDLFASTPNLDTVMARHIAENPSDTELLVHATIITNILNQISTSSTPVEELAAKTQEKDFTTKAEHLALYFDAFKQRGAYDEARQAVKFILPKRTAFGRNDLYAKKLKGDLSWMEETMSGSTLLAKYWKKRFIDTFRIHLFGPARVEQDLGPDRPFNDVFEEQMAGAAAPTALIDSERRFYALAALKYLNDFRVTLLRAARQQDQKYDTTFFRVERRQAYARMLAQPGKLEELATTWDLPEEPMHLLNLVADEIRDVANAADAFWERVGEFDRVRREGGEFESFGNILKLLGEVKDIKELKNLERDLLRIAKAAFYLPAGKTPSVETYKGMMKMQADALLALATNYDLKIFPLARAQSEGKTIDEKSYIMLGWVQWFLMVISLRMRKFEPAPVAAGATDAEKRARQDELVKHRLLMAHWWFSVARQLKMNDLMQFLADVALGQQQPQYQSQLAMWGEWKLDEESGLSLMSKEFPKGVMRGLEPLTGADIANFSYMLYAEDLATQIWTILEREGMKTDFSGAKPLVINQAIERAKKFAYPKRFLLKDYVAAIIPKDRDHFNRLVEKHPKYAEFAATVSPDDVIVVPAEYETHLRSDAIVAWTVPRLSQLADILAMNVPGLDALVRVEMEKNQAAYEETLKKAKQGTKPEPLGDEWFQWLKALIAVIKADPTIEAKIHAAIVEGYQAAVTLLDQEARLATSHTRRVILEQNLIQLWSQYDPADIATYSKPNDAVRMMLDFASHVSPPKDVSLQMAALIIELGPLLYSRLGPQEVLWGALETVGTQRFDLISAILPHLVGTLALAADAKNLAVIKTLNLLVPQGFDKHVEAVQKLKTQTEQTTLEFQLSRELIVSKEGQAISTSSWSYVLYPGPENSFTIDGNEYELLEVYESFTFVPGVIMAAGGIDWPESELGDSLLTYANGKVAKKTDRTGNKLFKMVRNGVEMEVLDNDERLLSEIMHVVTMRGFVRSMEQLGAALEVYADVLMTGMEFIPGIGPPLMVARILTAILTFIASPQFAEIKEALGGDTGKIAEQAIDKMKELFTADVLWSWLLFGEPSLPSLPVLGQTSKQQKVVARHGQGSAAQRLGSILGRIFRIAARLGLAVGRLHDKFEYPMRRTQVFVISHPLIALVLNFIVENFQRLSALQLSELSLSVDLTAKKITEEMGNLSARVSEMLEHVQQLQLPQELIPLDNIINLVVELVIERLPGKYKLVAKGVREGLELIHAWDKIVSAVADQMKAANMDPNSLWRELIRSKLEPLFEELATEFATAVGSTLNEVPFLRGIAQPTGPDVQFELETGEFPEAQELPSEHPVTSAPLLVSWPYSTGARLEPPLIRDASRRFGHDLSHVRLHTGPDAAQLTKSLGAEGVTSGSHVYLRPGLSPRFGYGADVFHHELSHVIQQTGPRPLGRRHSPAPVFGEHGRGVRHDSHLEAAADRAANLAKAAPIAVQPLNPGSTNVRAPQPKLDPKLDRLMKQFFTAVGADKPLRERTEEITAGKGAPTGVRLSTYASRVVTELPTKLRSAIANLKNHKTTFPGYLEPIHKDVIDYLLSNHWTTISSATNQIVKRTHEGKLVKTVDSSGATKEKVDWTFIPSRLEQELEEYIFGLTGVLFDIEFHLEPSTVGGTTPAPKQVDLANPFKTLKVLALHLAYVGGTADLWNDIIKNTWISHVPKIVPPSRFKNTADFPNQNEAIAAYKLNARLVLRDAGPQPKVFMISEFRFSDWFAKQVEDSTFTVAGGNLDPKTIGPWNDYTSPDHTTQNYSTASGHIHLAFGTYDERTKPGTQWGVARNAHHTTQYLILEYLRNRKTDQKPFRHALKNYPGVSGSGTLVNTIEKPDGSRTINVGTYEAGRGGKMPTILISEHTHQQGGVHVHGKPDDAPGSSSPSTPGFAVHNEFKTHLGPYADIMFDASPVKLQTVAKQTKGEPVTVGQEINIGGTLVTSDKLQEAIFSAACNTYKWMRNDMSTKLRTALKTEEVHYYETMMRRQMQEAGRTDYNTAALLPGYEPIATDLNTTADRAEQHNKAIMEDAAKVGFQVS